MFDSIDIILAFGVIDVVLVVVRDLGRGISDFVLTYVSDVSPRIGRPLYAFVQEGIYREIDLMSAGCVAYGAVFVEDIDYAGSVG